MADLQVVSTYSGREVIQQLEHMFSASGQPGADCFVILHVVDAGLSEPFPRRVYALVAQVPHGRVITYGAIAQLLGEPRKARQVGWAMAATHDPIPAHRVINSRGELSGGPAFGGYAVQRALLEGEGVQFLPDGRIDLDQYLWLPTEKLDVRS
jgi:methylated-DNA-protein-cysteine methyltransferase-like protein